jgi:hypothetical protein
MSDNVKVNYSERELHAVFDEAVDDALVALAVPDDEEHAARVVRALIEIGAEVAIRFGCALPDFLTAAAESFVSQNDGSALPHSFQAADKTPASA